MFRAQCRQRTYELLKSVGLKPTVDGDLLLRTCVSNKYFRTAALLVRDGMCVLTKDMLAIVPSAEGLTWCAFALSLCAVLLSCLL